MVSYLLEFDEDDRLVEGSRDYPVNPDAKEAGRIVAASKKLTPKKKKKRKRGLAPPGVDAFSIREFCRRNAISVALFFKLQGEGKGPVTMKVGGRKLISMEAAAAWRRQREAEATAEANHQNGENSVST